MTLPEHALRLLGTLQEDHARLIRQTPGLGADVASSNWLSLGAVEAALARAAERERQLPGRQRPLLRALTALAVIRRDGPNAIAPHAMPCMLTRACF